MFPRGLHLRFFHGSIYFSWDKIIDFLYSFHVGNCAYFHFKVYHFHVLDLTNFSRTQSELSRVVYKIFTEGSELSRTKTRKFLWMGLLFHGKKTLNILAAWFF